MEQLGVAVVGCGRISASHLGGIREMPDQVALIATVDELEDRARRAAEQYGARRSYASLEQALHDPEVEAVILALPHHLHHSAAMRALEAGKHVLVEKPMASTYRQAAEMVARAREVGRVLMAGQSRRYFDAVRESKRRSKDIGRIIHLVTIWHSLLDRPATSWWTDAARTGGLLIPLIGSHAVDYVTWIMERLPSTVYARTLRVNPLWEGEDEVAMLLDFEDATAGIHLSFNTRQPVYTRLLVGTRGTISLEGEEALTVDGRVVVSGEQKPTSFARQVEEFARSIREGREPLSSGSAVAPTIAVLDAARLSASSGRVVPVHEMLKT